MDSAIVQDFLERGLGKGSKKQNLLNHIGDVFSEIVLTKSKNCFTQFEKMSLSMKKANHALQQAAGELPKYEKKPDQWLKKSKALLDKPKGRVVKKDGNAKREVLKNLGKVPDLMKVSDMLEWAGFALGDQMEVYQIQLSLKHLAAKTGAQELKFWGKIFGRKSDYFVAQGYLPPTAAPNSLPQLEPRGQVGANYYTYWVTDNVLEDWVELPVVLPEHIIASRDIKHIFIGELNADVLSYPIFPGKERHLLRAQIARITHSCQIAPKDIYKEKEIEGEEDKEFKDIQVSEEAKIPGLAELNSLESWVHIPPYLLKAGRISHLEPVQPQDPPQGWDAEAELQRIKELDPQVAQLRFSPLSEENEAPLWQMKLVGDNQPYNLLSGDGTESYATVVLKNTNWPGSVTVAHFGSYANLYLGFGMKAGGNAFNPIQPPDVMDDPQEPKQQPEPYPLEDPVEKPETDTDEPQGKEEEED